MQRGYGYPQQRNSSYRYQGPSTAQYESFFNPIPIDFLQQNLQQHQGQYDQAFAGALTAKEAAAQQEIALGDEIYRNQLVDQSMQEMDKLAEQYGGDYGRAAKGIAREVTNLRSDPFWNMSKHAKEQQAMQQKWMLDNPTGWVTGDVMNKGVYDSGNERLRTPDELTFKGVEHGDWAGSLKNMAGLLTPDKDALGLSDAEIDGVLKYGSFTHIDDDKIQAILDNTSVVNKFLADNPDFRMAFNEGMHYQGFDSVEAAAKDYISGGLDPTKFGQNDRKYMDDPGFDDSGSGGSKAGAMIFTNVSPAFDMTAEKGDVSTKALQDLEASRWEASQLPDGDPRKAEIEQQAQDVYNRLDMVMNTVKMSSEYGITDADMYSDYQNAQAGSALIPEMTEDEFQEELQGHIEKGTTPEKFYNGSTNTKPGISTTASPESAKNPMWDAVDNMRKAMKQAVKDEKGIAITGRTIRGTSGNQQLNTEVEHLNGLGQTTWTDSVTDFTIPNTGQQADAWLNEKYPTDARNEKKRRDRSKDKLVMLDTPINGKLSFMLTTFNPLGDPLATIPVAPGDQQNLRINTMRVARNMADLGYGEQANELVANTLFRPIMQKANIAGKTSGTFAFAEQGVANDVHFEKSGTTTNPVYKMFTMIDGKKDYFRETEDGEPILYTGEEDMLEGILTDAM